MCTVKDLLNKYGFALSDSGGGCQWATRETKDGSGFFAITDYGGCDIPRTLDEPILVGLYDSDRDDEQCARWPWGLECYLVTHFDPVEGA